MHLNKDGNNNGKYDGENEWDITTVRMKDVCQSEAVQRRNLVACMG